MVLSWEEMKVAFLKPGSAAFAFMLIFFAILGSVLIFQRVRTHSLLEEENYVEKVSRNETTGSHCGCPTHGRWYFNYCFCHPSYIGEGCCEKLHVDRRTLKKCPNLNQTATYDKFMPDTHLSPTCFAHPETGIIQVPLFIWTRAQRAELHTWTKRREQGDRTFEHLEGFVGFSHVPTHLGNLAEIGAGPFTQVYYMLQIRSKLKVKHITLVEPMAKIYMNRVDTCTYKDGQILDYPTTIVSSPGEAFSRPHAFDSLISINVIEHVQDALEFLQNIYTSLKDNGILIWHERWYETPAHGRCTLGSYNLHPIRISLIVLEKFLAGFEPIFTNTKPTLGNLWRECNETGIYYIGRKKPGFEMLLVSEQ